VYEREQRVDLLLSLDTIYKGKIKQSKSRDTTTLFFSDLSALKHEQFKSKTDFLRLITITPEKNRLKVTIKGDNFTKVSKTIDGHAVRIRITPTQEITQIPATKTLDVKKVAQPTERGIDKEIKIVVLFTLVLLLVWFLVKIFTRTKGEQSSGDIELLGTKMIDPKQKVLIIGYKDRQYLILSAPSGNLFIDSMPREEEHKGSSFNRMLKKSQKNT
jgi:flagellar biogenesis protein FliO